MVEAMDNFDVVIVGSAINSLVCAAMLVRKGKRICLLERNAVAGGLYTYGGDHRSRLSA